MSSRTPRQIAAARGAYYRQRTRTWLEAQGYEVGTLEIVRTLWGSGRCVKHDQFGADLLAVNETVVAFVQVKFQGPGADSKASLARAEFRRHRHGCGQQWLVTWRLRARAPEVEVVSEAPFGPGRCPQCGGPTRLSGEAVESGLAWTRCCQNACGWRVVV